MLATKSSVLVMVILISVCWIAGVDSFCNGCSCNILRCNCDCWPRNYCPQIKRMCYAPGPYFGRRAITDDETSITVNETSITDDETDPSIKFAKLDKNEVRHFIG